MSKPKKLAPPKKDPKKENIFKELSQLFGEQGYIIRREKLKTGPGWRVLSGECMHEGEKCIFVDSIMSQDDQIEFLLSKADEVKIQIPETIKNSSWRI